MARLTKRSVEALEPKTGSYFVWDEELKASESAYRPKVPKPSWHSTAPAVASGGSRLGGSTH